MESFSVKTTALPPSSHTYLHTRDFHRVLKEKIVKLY